jgi:class 3 adenylate cyclase
MILRLREMRFSIGEIAIGIGLHCGKVIHGRIGSDERLLQYTVLGDPVNTTARLSDVAAPNQIVLSPRCSWLWGNPSRRRPSGEFA